MTTYPNVKINLGLNVLRRRADGYHDLDTCFIPYFGLSDVLEIEEASECRFEIVWQDGTPVGWEVEKDLSVRAYRLLCRDFALPPVRLSLCKRSAVGAGLGGGSSDAAFALRMLSELFSLALSDEALARYASQLGSDCAFFIYNRPMLGSGRGEVLKPLELDLSPYNIKVTVPEGVSVSTAEAYRGVVPRIPDVSIAEVLRRPVRQWKDLLVNDFEESVFALHPRLAEIKRQFYDSGALYSAMSGSGSAVFGIFEK